LVCNRSGMCSYLGCVCTRLLGVSLPNFQCRSALLVTKHNCHVDAVSTLHDVGLIGHARHLVKHISKHHLQLNLQEHQSSSDKCKLMAQRVRIQKANVIVLAVSNADEQVVSTNLYIVVQRAGTEAEALDGLVRHSDTGQ
jgi:hypothetical protein